MLEHILSGVGGGFRGAAEGYQWGKEYQQKEELLQERLASQEKVAQLRVLVQEAIAAMKERGADGRHDRPSGDTTAREDGLKYRHDNVSGNVEFQQSNQNLRHSLDNTFRYDALETGDATDRYMHDTASGNARLASGDRRFMHTTPSGNARLGANVALRGQDVASGDRRYGIDVGARTTQRGQDVSREVGLGRNKVASRRVDALMSSLFEEAPPMGEEGEDVLLPPEAPAAQAPAAASTFQWPDGTTRAYAPPPEAPAVGPAALPVMPKPSAPAAPARGALPVGPRKPAAAPAKPAAAPAPDPAAGRGDPFTELTLRATTLLRQKQAEKDPKKKEALRQELARLLEEKKRLTGGR